MRGNLFESAIMKTSVISDEFRSRYLSDPQDPEAFEGRAVVFDGPEDYHAKLMTRHSGSRRATSCLCAGQGGGLPGRRRGGQHATPAYLIKQGITALPCIGDGRQSGTSGSPSILMPRPRLRLMELSRCCAQETGANRFAQRQRECVAFRAELDARRAALSAAGGYKYPVSQTPWQELQRRVVGPLGTGAIIEVRRSTRRSINVRYTPDNH